MLYVKLDVCKLSRLPIKQIISICIKFYHFAYNLHVLELKDGKYVASVDDRNA